MAKNPYWLPGILVLAFLVRLFYFFQLSATPFAGHLFLDSQLYDEWAARIVSGDLLAGRGAFFTEPGYAYLLAAIKLAGGGIGVVRLLQALIGTGTVALTVLLARRLGGERPGKRAGLVAGLIAALYLPLIYFEGLVLKTTLEVFLSITLLYLIALMPEQPNHRRALGLGLMAGAAILIRSNILALVLLGAIWLAVVLRQRAESRWWLPPALLLVGPCLVLSGTAVRSYLLAGELTPLTYNSGINFYIGNCLACTGGDPTYPFGRGLPQFEEEDSRLEAERRAGRPLTAAESSSFWWHETWSEIAGAPGRWLKLLGVKLLLFWNHYEITDNLSLYFVQQWVPLLRRPLPGFWLAVPLGFAGMAYALWKRGAVEILALSYVLLQVVIVVLFHVGERYRLSAVPVLLALGSAAIVDVATRQTRAGWLSLAAGLVGVAVVALPNPINPRGQNLTNHYDLLGAAAISAGKSDEAVAILRNAVRDDPESADHHYNLAVALGSLAQDYAGAEAELIDALRLRPEMGEAHFELGRVLDKLNRPEEAARSFEKAATLDYKPGESLISAAAMYGRLRRFDEALKRVEEGLRKRPEDAHGWEVLGGIRYEQGDRAAAFVAWDKSLRLNPDNARLRAFLEKARHP